MLLTISFGTSYIYILHLIHLYTNAVYVVFRATILTFQCFQFHRIVNMNMMEIFIIRPHRRNTYVDAAYCCRPSSVVCLSVCHIVRPTKTADPIEMPFGMLSRVDQMSHVLDGVQMPQQKWSLLGECLAH